MSCIFFIDKLLLNNGIKFGQKIDLPQASVQYILLMPSYRRSTKTNPFMFSAQREKGPNWSQKYSSTRMMMFIISKAVLSQFPNALGQSRKQSNLYEKP